MHRALPSLMLLFAPTLVCACSGERAGSPLRPAAAVSAAGDSEEILFQVRGNRSVAQTFSSGFHDDTLTRVLVTVFSNNDSTLLTYDVNKCPFPFIFCFSTERGFGLIPGADLAVTGTGATRLHTNTAAGANPAFQRTAGAGGEIVVTWTPTLGGATSDEKGTSTLLMGGEFTRTSGRMSSTDADVSGAVVGTPVNQGSCQAFTSTRVGMTIQVVRSQMSESNRVMNLPHAVGGAAAALEIAVTAPPIAAQDTVLRRFSGTDDFASLVTSGRIGDTVTNVTVLVSRGRNAGQVQALLRYDIVKCDVPTNSCARVESGFGLIPTTNVTGSGNSTLRVLTDTRPEANPEFTRFAGSGGIVDVTLRTAPGGPLMDASFQGVQTTGSLGLFTRSTGRRVTGNGEAEGTVLGIPARLDSFRSVISANVGMTFEILRNDQGP